MKSNLKTRLAQVLVLTATLSANSLFAQAVQVDKAIPAYQKTSGVSGNLNSIGSDTLNNLLTLWAEGFQKQYPNVRIQIEGKGSSTAPPALIAGTAQLGPMSREMKSTEIDEFEKKYGYKPTAIAVAIDALAVYVNKDNPLEQLTIQQVDAIFSKGRACGGKPVKTWADLGLGGAYGGKPISLYGRNSASGTYGFFKENALCKGDYKDTVKEQPGSASVVQGITEDQFAMGYSGIGYKTSGVKTLKLAKKPGEFYGTDAQTVLSGKYPLSRFLYIYINEAPNKPLSPLVREFVKYVLSQEGQQIVVKDGFLPISAKTAQEQGGKLK
jgi:phosphate transport system substrate-binding protein